MRMAAQSAKNTRNDGLDAELPPMGPQGLAQLLHLDLVPPVFRFVALVREILEPVKEVQSNTRE